MVGTACGDKNGVGEIWSTAPIDRALCEKLVECGCGEAFAELDAPVPLTCEGWTLASVLYGGDDDDPYYYGYGYEGGYEGGYYEPLPASVDEECIRKLAQRIDAIDCNLQFTDGDCRDFCFPVIGPRFAGEPCDSQTDCGRNLICDRGECKDACAVRPPAEGDQCDDGNDCGDELVCANEDDDTMGVCIALPVAGQQCYFGACAPGLVCEPDDTDNGTCRALTAVGNACMGHGECATNYCPAGYCEERPGPGQACGANGICGPGTDCVSDDDGNGLCVPLSNACLDFVDAVLDTAYIVGVSFD